MPIVKSTQAKPLLKEAIVLDLGDIGRQAARLRMAAEAKASQIVTDAERKAQQLVEGAEARGFEQGRAAGYEQGLAEGRQQGHEQALQEMREQLQQVQAAWSDVAQQWEAQRRQMHREAKQAVLDFALKLAEKLVHRVIEVDRSVVVDQVATALAHVLRPLDVTVTIHPDDRPILEAALPELLNEFNHLERIDLAEDDQISRGGCVVSFGQGRVDATVEKQIERVIDAILPAEDELAEDEPADAGEVMEIDDSQLPDATDDDAPDETPNDPPNQ